MAQKTDLNISPYYDDYSESKDFHKVLYRAGRPLQARELIQSQSLLQNQIEKFGDHFFEEGSIVTGAQSDVDFDLYYVKVLASNPNSSGDSAVESYRESYHDKYLIGKTTGVVAKVINSDAETSTDYITLYIRLERQGTDANNSFAFSGDEVLAPCGFNSDGDVTEDTSNNNHFKVAPQSVTPVGRTSIANIAEGVVYIRGFFVRVPAQQLVLEKYNSKPSYRVGLTITESFISTAEDSSLYDNAQGTSNENAAGADRLKFTLTLSKYALTSTEDANFVELVRVNNGVIELKTTRPIYTEIENTLARRTFDANGDFIVQQFTHSLREHLDDTTNAGFYLKAQGGDESKFVFQVSPGKAYVKGYEIDKIGTTNLNINKARQTTTISGAKTPSRLGNYVKVANTFGYPDFGNEAGQQALTPFAPVHLFPSKITSAGTLNSEDHIGFARVRHIENYGTTLAETSLYLFDIKMFTKIGYQSHLGTAHAGDKVTGGTSGATGIVAYDNNSNALYVHDVVGTFVHGEAITSTGDGDFSCTSYGDTYRSTSREIRSYNIDRVRGMGQERSDATLADFTADLIVDQDTQLTGTVIFEANGTDLTGFGTRFTAELKEGDIVHNPASGQDLIVASVTSSIAAVLTTNSTAVYQGNATRRRTKIYDQDQSVSIYAWPRDYVKNHTPDQVTVKKQKVIRVSGGKVTLTTDNNESFLQMSQDNFQLSIYDLNGASGGANTLGAELDPVATAGAKSNPTATTEQYQFTTSAANGVDYLVSYAVNLDAPVNRDKTLNRSRCSIVTAAKSSSVDYGTAYDHKDITLGVADVLAVRGIYEGIGGSTPLPPSAILGSVTGLPVKDEILVGQTSGARARIIQYNSGSATYFYYTNNFVFEDGESVVGQTSNAIATLGTITAGSDNITDRYFFDNGQRDGYYDHAKITLKPGQPLPNNSILIVFDNFTSSGGEFYDVNSYSGIDYKDIPVYTPNKVDLGGLEPDGEYELSDAVDFRPTVAQLYSSSTFSSADPDPTSPANISTGLTGDPFEYNSKVFTGTGSSALDTPVPGLNTTGDIEFYTSRIDRIFLQRDGMFEISTGNPSLSPTKPKAVDEAIEMFELFIPAYTKDISKIRVRSFDHRRYTMKDIGRINNRVTNLERVTSLSMLEKDTQTKQILDADGFDRFKSGFLVDNFRGHKIGDVNHPDYKCAIDTKMGMLRPQNLQQFFDLDLNTTTSSNYQKTGDLITLPYTPISYVNQDKASRHINVNPYHVFAFVGNVKLTPGTDIWNDTERLPDVRINREGNFDAVMAGVGNSLGTVWNSWQTTWVGEPAEVSSEVQSTSAGSWSGDPSQGGTWQAGQEITREITETPEIQTRTGITTSVVEDFVETRNDRVVSVSIIPFMRARTIEIDATNLKPNTNHFFFFDNVRVDKFCRPHSAPYSADGGLTVASNLQSDGNGRLRGFFELPNSSTQRFPTGQRELKLTSSFYNLSNPPSQGSATYQAQGLLNSSQTEIVSTRNGRVITQNTSGERRTQRRGERLNISAIDTVAPDIPVDTTPIVVPTPTTIDVVIPPEVFVPPVINIPVPPPEPPALPIRVLPIEDSPRRGSFLERGWGDPLAQSFLCEASGGMMLTSIDLFFQAKDSHMPVSVEIRNMVNGYPGQVVLPFSTVTKNPSDVNVSADGSVSTTFTFDSPVYVEEKKEYCFVVYSNSNEYECWISRMGETDLISGQQISGQPYAGSLFMSQNASTWTAEQTDDLKFNMKIAKFDTSKIPSIYFDNKDLDLSTLAKNPIQTTVSSNTVKVAAYLHGLYDNTSNTQLSGITGDRIGSVLSTSGANITDNTSLSDGTYPIAATSVSPVGGSGAEFSVTIASGAVGDVRITNPGQGYSANDVITLENFDGGQADMTVTVASVGQTLGGIPVDAIGGSSAVTYTSISNTGIDSFDIAVDLSSYIGANKLATGYDALESTSGGGEAVKLQRNYYFDALHTMIPSTQIGGSKIIASINTTAMKSPEGVIGSGDTVYTKRSTNNFITLNDNTFLDNPGVVASPINETNEMQSQRSFSLLTQLYSVNQNVSPVIDVGTIGCIAIANRLNNIDTSNDVPSGVTYVPSTEPEGDSNAFVYVTRKVNLKTPATSLKVIADNFRPPNTEFKYMFKIIKADENTPLDDIGFEFFNSDGTPDTAVEVDGRNFKEYEYTAEDLPEFTAFVIKIVGQGTNTCAVPMVSSLRVMALA